MLFMFNMQRLPWPSQCATSRLERQQFNTNEAHLPTGSNMQQLKAPSMTASLYSVDGYNLIRVARRSNPVYSPWWSRIAKMTLQVEGCSRRRHTVSLMVSWMARPWSALGINLVFVGLQSGNCMPLYVTHSRP